MRTKLFAMASGFILGGLLYVAENFRVYVPWMESRYEAALLLTGIGLGWYFSKAWLSATLSLCISSFLIELVTGQRDYEGFWRLQLILVFVLGFPIPFIGGIIGYQLRRIRIPRSLCLVPLLAALGIGVVMPLLRLIDYRRFAAQKISSLMKQTYEAEISYRWGQADHAFTWDGAELPVVRQLPWSSYGAKHSSWVVLQHYTMRVDSPQADRPQSFCIWAYSHDATQPGPTYWIDQRGKLMEGESAAYVQDPAYIGGDQDSTAKTIREEMCPIQ
jgi:hypothetical protein